MNIHRIFYLTCYDNELSWLHHNSIWFSSIFINCIALLCTTQNTSRVTLAIYNLLQCIYPIVGYYIQYEGNNMPIIVKNYCDPFFFSTYWTIVTYSGPLNLVGGDVVGILNAFYILMNAVLFAIFAIRRYYIVTNPKEYRKYIEKSEFYRKPTIEFGEILVS